MQALLDVSPFYSGQLRFVSDDPLFRKNSGCESLLTDDNHIVNQDQAYEICQKASSVYQLSITDAASKRLIELCSDYTPKTKSFKLPYGGFEFKRFQKRAINVMEHEKNVMLQMSCGCGKTCISIFMACQRFDKGVGNKIVVWVPSALIFDWVESFCNFTNLSVGTPPIGRPPNKRKEWYQTDKSDVWILNYERVRTCDIAPITKELKGTNPIFVFDEVQKLMNRTSNLHREMSKLWKSVGASCKIALTATPIVRGPENFYNEFRIIQPEIFGRVKDFEELFTFNSGEKTIYGDYLGYKNLPYMHLMAGKHVFSATKARREIACEFPQKNEILIEYDLTKEQRRVYDEIHAYGASLSPDERCGPLFMLAFERLCNMPKVLLEHHIYDDSPYSQQLRVIDEICAGYRQKLEIPKNCAKLQILLEKMEEIMYSGEKAIIFAQHTHNCILPLVEYLAKYKPLVYTGESTAEEKEFIKNEFKHSPKRNLLLMSDAGQVGLNFQECRYVLHYQTPVSHAAYEQRSDRCHRIDSEFSSVDIIRFCGRNTIEVAIEDTMQGRREIAKDMGLGGELNEFEEYSSISADDANYFCGF